MGHDICGFNKADEETRSEIAYLRRNAFNPLKNAIYNALGAEEQNCGCSGCGGDPIHFTEDQLKEAMAKLPEGENYQPERDFLAGCLSNGAAGAWIAFW